METFFYSAIKSCGVCCQWQVCPNRYLARLKLNKGLKNIQTINGKISFVSGSLKAIPKSGDIVILYAVDSLAMDELVGVRDGFEGLRKILVVADSTGSEPEKYHMLEPRFITHIERDISELQAVIQKMTAAIH